MGATTSGGACNVSPPLALKTDAAVADKVAFIASVAATSYAECLILFLLKSGEMAADAVVEGLQLVSLIKKGCADMTAALGNQIQNLRALLLTKHASKRGQRGAIERFSKLRVRTPYDFVLCLLNFMFANIAKID